MYPGIADRDAEGDHIPGTPTMKIKIIAPPERQVLRLDRRLHPGLPLHLPADVDQQAGVTRDSCTTSTCGPPIPTGSRDS
ncbi:hypothetical protein AALO_G00309990 [Alosa alosa]|uniref:Uncharacterized protein n=1 Tax=Alosa alosa TaxID=278164 RepID=A0AAV6FDJ0_9TELE|nr:hypothetical protein AALO_G00309990 [Alosa alosa]